MPGYFETLSIPLLRGRTFARADNDPSSTPSQSSIKASPRNFSPTKIRVGQYFTPNLDTRRGTVVARQIIGVVGNTRTSDMWNPYQPQFFLPYAQDPTHQRTIIVMRVAGDPHNYENTVRKIVATIEPMLPLRLSHFFRNHQEQAAQPRFEAALVTAFAAIALLCRRSAFTQYSRMSSPKESANSASE